jgi:DNA invertase Pin-like site-specific DNA recombinase
MAPALSEVDAMASKHVRCAIYTRKSSEEGLEQSFNSLDAQREACRAFILSQKHEGWTALNGRYDDGGFSGGTMERPALKQLLADILAGKLDTVVVYKVDRLTRSLTDFAKIIDVFDSHGVSFVSVTQQFNTTTSMGRLTLNVLLSFAQFEREVTGERIRDKLAASKKKGMWMGGVVPLGYDCVDHRLVVNRPEAATVRKIFRRYLRLGCVKKLRDYLDRNEIRSKLRKSSAGRTSGGTSYSRGALYHLLNNRVYIGEIVHRGESYPGQHEAIVPRELWDQVSARLQTNNQAQRNTKSQSTPSLLSGMVFDTKGVRFTPTHAVKNGKRYRYYTSQAVIQRTGDQPAVSRFPAQELEKLVTSQVQGLLASPDKCTACLEGSPEKDVAADRALDLSKRWPNLEISTQQEFVRNVVRRVVVGQTAVWIEIDRAKLVENLLGGKPESGGATCNQRPDTLRLTANFQPHRRGDELHLTTPTGSCSDGSPVPSLVKAIARARDWYDRIIRGELRYPRSIVQLTDLDERYVRRILRCAFLAPDIVDAILEGRQPPSITLHDLLSDLPSDWVTQRRRLGFAAK